VRNRVCRPPRKEEGKEERLRKEDSCVGLMLEDTSSTSCNHTSYERRLTIAAERVESEETLVCHNCSRRFPTTSPSDNLSSLTWTGYMT